MGHAPFGWSVDRPPPLSEAEQVFINAYLACDTCRSVGIEPGPIPYTAVSVWCRDHGVVDLLDDIWFVVHRADMIVMKDRSDRLREEREGSGSVKNAS